MPSIYICVPCIYMMMTQCSPLSLLGVTPCIVPTAMKNPSIMPQHLSAVRTVSPIILFLLLFFFKSQNIYSLFFISLSLFWQSECVTLLTFFFYNLPLSLGVCVYSTQWNNFDEKKFKLPVIVFVCVHIYYELLCDRQCSINQVCVLSNRLYQ